MDSASGRMNDSGTSGSIDTGLTQACSPDVLNRTIRDLIVMRAAHGADSPIGHRCSNLVELIQTPNPPADLIQRQMTDLARLRAGLQ